MKMRRRGSFHCVRATFMLHIYLIRYLIAWNDQKCLAIEVELMVHGIGLSNGISWSCRNVDILLRRAKILALHIWYYRNCPGQGWGGHRASAFRIVRGVVSVGSGLGALDTRHLISAASTIGPGLCHPVTIQTEIRFCITGNGLDVLSLIYISRESAL